MVSNSSNPERHPLTLWAMRLFGYDGLLPAVVLLVPAALTITIRKGFLIEFTAVVLPIIAYLIRGTLGLRNIKANVCSKPFKVLQGMSLFLGLIALLLVDAFLILSWSLPANALSQRDYEITALIYGCYLVLMALASFPGFAK